MRHMASLDVISFEMDRSDFNDDVVIGYLTNHQPNHKENACECM